MKVLGIDSATSACSVAVSDQGRLLARRFELMSRGQSEAMMPMIESVLNDIEMTVSDMDLIAVTVGPGAFTGLRTAIATAQGLSIATGVQTVGVSTTEAIAFAARREFPDLGNIIVALDSRRDDLYVQAFTKNGDSCGTVEAIAPTCLNQWVSDLASTYPYILLGDAAERAQGLLGDDRVSLGPAGAPTVPDAQYVAECALANVKANKSGLDPKPLYLRPPDAVVPVNGGRLRP